MAFLNDPPPQPETPRFQKYPLVMYRGTEARRVIDAEGELAAESQGYTTTPPVIPAPPEPKPVLTLEERVQALEDQIAAMFPKRKQK